MRPLLDALVFAGESSVKALKEVVVRMCLMADLLSGLPIFLLLICISPEKYAKTLAASGETINRRIMEYRR